MQGYYPTDKFESGYVETYQGLVQTLPSARPSVCEVGVYQGGSLQLWMDMIPDHSVVVGVDVNPEAVWPPGSVKVVANQQDPTLADQLRVHSLDGYDLVIDDASHIGQYTYKTFQHLWPLVKPGGFYVIEDWLVGFPAYSNFDDSMLNLAMMLLVHFNPAEETDIHFITYQPGMIIIHKKTNA